MDEGDPNTPLTPWMTEAEIRLVEHSLLRFETDCLHVLEWGSGGSTLHFTRFLRAAGQRYQWVTVEHCAAWHVRISRMASKDPCVSIHLREINGRDTSPQESQVAAYVEFPSTLGHQFHVVLVDGRYRRRCLIEAEHLLTRDGVALLHDAQRPHYWCAMESYPQSCFLAPNLWCGSRAAIRPRNSQRHASRQVGR